MKLKATAQAALWAMSSLAASVCAQQTPQPQGAGNSSGEANAVQEVVVTATRRESTLQETPLPVSALTGKRLEERGIGSVADAVALVPGVSVGSNQAGDNQITVRGVNTSVSTLTLVGAITNSTSSVYLGQLPVTSTVAKTPDFRFVDMERVEVIRGPQGTLYGQSAMGGVVRYIPNRPDTGGLYGSVGGYLSSTHHGDSNKGLEGWVNVPLGKNAALRAAVYDYDNDGFIDVVGFSPKKRANAEKTTGGRVALRWDLTNRLSVDLNYLGHQVDLGSQQMISSTYTPTGNAALQGVPQNLKAVSTSRLEAQLAQPTAASYDIFSVEATQRFDTMDATLVLGQKNSNYRFVLEAAQISGYSETNFGNLTVGESTSKTAELRLVSKNKNALVDWIMGVYHEKNDGLLASRAGLSGVAVPLIPGVFVLNPGDVTIDNGRKLDYTETSVYGELGLNLSKQWRLSAGMRHAQVENNYVWSYARGLTDPFLGRPALVGKNQPSSEDVDTYRVNLSFKPSADAMVYATAGSGYRPGGFNPGTALATPAIPDNTFRSDKLWNYEIGAKTTWLDKRLVLNASAYRIDWSDIQLAVINPAAGFYTATVNAGKARIDGLELEMSLRATRSLSFAASFASTDARLVAAAKSPIGGFATGAAGDPLPGTPKQSFTLMADWRSKLGSGTDVFANATYRSVGARYYSIGGTSQMPAYETLDLRLGVGFRNGLKLTLFADNATNEIAVLNVVSGAFFSTQPFSWYQINRPRTVGLRAGYDF